ncbi:MAG: hypothetical protein O2809_03665 [Proteobacteria bacterium]|nr:hypothetical protein [Pseudomonadota bacterium]
MQSNNHQHDLYNIIRSFAHDLKATKIKNYSETLIDDIDYSNSATETLMKLKYHLTEVLNYKVIDQDQECELKSMLNEIENYLTT